MEVVAQVLGRYDRKEIGECSPETTSISLPHYQAHFR